VVRAIAAKTTSPSVAKCCPVYQERLQGITSDNISVLLPESTIEKHDLEHVVVAQECLPQIHLVETPIQPGIRIFEWKKYIVDVYYDARPQPRQNWKK